MRSWAGIRARATIIATLVVLVVLVTALLTLAWTLRSSLVSNLDTSLQQQADDRLRLVEQGADPQSLTQVEGREAFVAILVGGEEAAISTDVTNLVRCAGPPCSAAVDFVEANGEVELHDVRVVEASSGSIVVVSGAELEDALRPVDTLLTAGLIGLPAVLALVSALVWITVGRVLAPVVDIRREADEIGGAGLDRRVPEPGTGDEIDDLARTVNVMLDRLAHESRAQRRFSSDASHELKSPVANVRALVDTARIDHPEWPTLRDDIRPEVDRIAGIVDDLLYLSIADERGSEEESFTRVHLDDVVFEEVEAAARNGAGRINAGQVTPATVDGDRASLQRLTRNLLENAGRYASSETVVSLTESGPEVDLVVDDDGPGIPIEDRERIFDRFARVGDARDRTTGSTGLGLAIVASIASHHGGRVRVEDGPRGGARFVVSLPRASQSLAD